MKHLPQLKQTLKDLFSIDSRSLALLRIGLAVVLILDIFNRLRDVGRHYTEQGVLSAGALTSNYGHHYLNTTFNLWTHTTPAMIMIFLVGIILAGTLLVGYKTRAATIGSWLFILVIHSKNFLVLQGGDDLLRMLLFWGMFLPLGATWSLDSGKKKGQQATKHFSIGSVGIMVQVALLFVLSVIHKSETSWLWSGEGMFYALSMQQFGTSLAGWTIQTVPVILPAFSRGMYLIHLIAPLFFFIPFRNHLTKLGGVVLVGLWALLTPLFMHLGLFPLVIMVALTPFIHTSLWKKEAVEETPRSMNRYIRWGFTIFGILSLAYVLAWHVTDLTESREKIELFYPYGDNLQIYQEWDMFSPTPPTNNGWHVLEGVTHGGARLDLLKYSQGKETLETLSYDEPDSIAGTYKNQRWRKYLMNLQDSNNKHYATDYLASVCKQYNKDYDDNLETLTLAFMLKRTLPEGQGYAEPQRTVIETYTCT